ncbi:site-specific DNA-methyltransferase [Trichothermofontia sichuanensis B231]|uniref:DNA methyltransferase n=1 Tax=Trichothermofontia sichuanensis TaxID=3045816 RepID=UPI002247DB30|nr:DNA methyltransferase [Trichothermofontia sichuanensis]UZQ54155.1 site-specific DNA-methyltransferase [Trichothermofontia sichuanensis B231]
MPSNALNKLALGSLQSEDYSRPEINQLRLEDRVVHDWYRFVLSFPPHLVQAYLNKFEIGDHQHVLDPFCGTGTTVVECKKLGIPSVGIEANPMAWFAGSVKQDWTPEPEALQAIAEAIAFTAATLIVESPTLRRLSPECEALTLKNSISPIPLHKTLILLDAIEQHSTQETIRHLKLALAKALVTTISNLRFGPEVGVGKLKEDAPVIEAWLQEVSTITQDLRQLQGLKAVPSQIYAADARQIQAVLLPQTIDAVITSPPYPNEKDYTRTTRLESVLLGFIKTKADLRTFKESLIRSNSRNVYKWDTDDRWVSQHSGIQAIAHEIETRRLELGKTSGFERSYHRAVKLYFGGMAKHLADLRPVLRAGAQLAYVVGDQRSYLRVMIRTGQILAELAEGLGYEVMGIDLFRTRTATITKEQVREEVVLLRWPGQWPDRPYPFSDFPLG